MNWQMGSVGWESGQIGIGWLDEQEYQRYLGWNGDVYIISQTDWQDEFSGNLLNQIGDK